MKYKKTLVVADMDFRNPSELTDKELKKEISKSLCMMYLEGKIDLTDVISSSTYININENLMNSIKEEKLHWNYV